MYQLVCTWGGGGGDAQVKENHIISYREQYEELRLHVMVHADLWT